MHTGVAPADITHHHHPRKPCNLQGLNQFRLFLYRKDGSCIEHCSAIGRNEITTPARYVAKSVKQITMHRLQPYLFIFANIKQRKFEALLALKSRLMTPEPTHRPFFPSAFVVWSRYTLHSSSGQFLEALGRNSPTDPSRHR